MKVPNCIILALIVTLSIESCKALTLTCDSPYFYYNLNGNNGVNFCSNRVSTQMMNPQVCVTQVNFSGLRVNVKMNFGTSNVYRMDMNQGDCFSASGAYSGSSFYLTISSNDIKCQSYQCQARLTVYY
jgi:hypothetical protein